MSGGSVAKRRTGKDTYIKIMLCGGKFNIGPGTIVSTNLRHRTVMSLITWQIPKGMLVNCFLSRDPWLASVIGSMMRLSSYSCRLSLDVRIAAFAAAVHSCLIFQCTNEMAANISRFGGAELAVLCRAIPDYFTWRSPKSAGRNSSCIAFSSRSKHDSMFGLVCGRYCHSCSTERWRAEWHVLHL